MSQSTRPLTSKFVFLECPNCHALPGDKHAYGCPYAPVVAIEEEYKQDKRIVVGAAEEHF